MKIKGLSIKNNELVVLTQNVLVIVALIGLCYGFQVAAMPDSFVIFIDIMIIGIVTVLLIAQFSSFELSEFQRFVILAGYLIRLLVMLIDIYASDYITILHSGDDTTGFYNIASQIFETGSAERSSSYTVILSKFFMIFGQNRLLAQYVNVLCYVATLIVILCTANKFQIERKYKTWVLAFLSLMPNYICLSSILLRESFMIFADVLAVYCFICWMMEDKITYFILAFVSALPAIILHSVSIGLWVSFLFIGFLWDGKRKRVSFNNRSILFVMIAVGIVIVFEMVPALRNLLMLYFPSDLSVNSLTMRYFEDGGSDYLRFVTINTWGQFYFWSIIKAIYFVLSPMPTDWRGLGDMAAFVMDSVPIIVMSAGIVRGMRHNSNIRYVWAGIINCLVIVGIFAWGVSNAGTAMRHRALLIGIFALTYVISKSGREHEYKKNHTRE